MAPKIQPDPPVTGGISELPPMSFDLHGRRYTIDTARLSAADIRRVRAESGLSLLEWFNAAYTTRMLDLDGLAVFVWVARTQAGETGRHGVPLTLAEVDKTIDYSDLERFNLNIGELEPEPEGTTNPN